MTPQNELRGRPESQILDFLYTLNVTNRKPWVVFIFFRDGNWKTVASYCDYIRHKHIGEVLLNLISFYIRTLYISSFTNQGHFDRGTPF